MPTGWIKESIARFIERPNRSILDEALHFELVRALYSTPKSIASATTVAVMILGVSWSLSDDLFYTIFFVGFFIVGVARTTTIFLYRRALHDPKDIASTSRWELRALLGAWSFAALVGLTGAYTLIAHPGTDAEVLVSCCVIGYIAGISSRNASRPVITIGQISLTCVPFTIALLLVADIVHLTLAIFICALHLSTMIICRTVFDNIISRHQAFNKIETLAHRDSLTELWNRAAFLDFLEKRLDIFPEGINSVGLIAIDLDRFKDINDTLGHPVGDAVLKEAAERIKSAVRQSDMVARIGGDEFLVMITGVNDAEVSRIAQHVIAKLSDPFTVKTTSSTCGASVGYAIAPIDGLTRDELMRNADLALYEAKRRGRGQIVAYTTALSRLYENRVALELDLQSALSKGELEVVYQPIVDHRSGITLCCEALLRWNHPERGTIAPSVFIPIAEATGLIVPIGKWVLEAACAEATHWNPEIKVAVNLSPEQFRRGRDIVDVAVAALGDAGLASHRLDLEVTESVLIEDTASTLAIVEDLRAKGIGVSLDDFGTGFSSLGYLNDFPFSRIKIDRKFAGNVIRSARTAMIIKGIAQITRDLKIDLVAEGVETEDQLAYMREFGIYAIQGYLFSKPVSVGHLRRIIGKPILPAIGQLRRSVGTSGKERPWNRRRVTKGARTLA